jgi:hypothetical protein
MLYGKYLPDTLEEMEPLFAAVAHGCLGGQHQDALNDVYYPRIQRDGNINYCCKQIGAVGADLAALSNFFKVPWHLPKSELSVEDRALVLGWASFRLGALGRLLEAVKPIQVGLDAHIKQKDFENAAIAACNLSELYLILGEVSQALEYARKSVDFADRSGFFFLENGI